MTLPEEIQAIKDIDWIELRKRSMAGKTRRRKNAAEWDSRATSFAKRVQHNDYINLVLNQLPLRPEMTLLDIGCGPGTLALPIARVTTAVTALDFSEKMIELLKDTAKEEGIRNITAKQLAWEDDWDAAEIKPHDITLASRSTAVADLPMVLKKLNDFAQRAVFLTDRVSPTPFELDAYKAIGVEYRPGPDYIYTLNILYSMGITANVQMLEFDRIRHYPSIKEAMESFLWMFDELSEEQTQKLEQYVLAISKKAPDGSLTVHRRTPPKWALLSWEK